MQRVLLFANDLMPFGALPTSGGGLRCWQLYQGLISRGYDVTVSMPSFTYLTEKHYSSIPEPEKRLLWNWDTQDRILANTQPDAVLFASNWDHYNLSEGSFDIPLIVDLHGSRLIETTMFRLAQRCGQKTQSIQPGRLSALRRHPAAVLLLWMAGPGRARA